MFAAMATRLQPSFGDLRTLGVSFKRTLLAENKSPRTIHIYMTAVTRFGEFLEATGMPTVAERVRREHIEAFIAELIETRAANTALTYYRSVRVFC
jgi:hypothetical protein